MQVVVRIGNLALGVFVTALVVRTLGREGYGQWSTIAVVLSVISYFSSFGMEEVALREAAREPEQEFEWLGAAIMMRLLLMGPVMIACLAAIALLQESNAMLIAGVILVVVMPFGGVGTLGLLFQLRVDNRVPMLVLTLRSILWGAAVVVIHVKHGGLVAFAIALVATNMVGSSVQALAALKVFGRWPRPSRARLRELARIAVPVGLSGALIMSYARIDQIFVFTICGSREAGLYGSVYNILDQSHFVPISILTTLSPVLAAAWPGDRARLLRTARLTGELLSVASFGGLAFAIVASGPVVRVIFGTAFSSAAPALPVLGTAFVLICFGYLNGNLLLVLGMQKKLLRVSLIALVVNLIGNAILVPLVGFMGAAAMTVVTEAVVFCCTSVLISRRLELGRPRVGRLARTALAALLMGIGLALLRLASAPLAALIAFACVAYPALLFSMRVLGADDIRVLIKRGSPA
jgi:O-antigen/teichoic acid export membrane protein